MRKPTPRLVEHIRAAAFDLDGTLIDTAPDLAVAANAMLRELGYRELPLTRFEALIGDGIDALTARAFAESAGSPIEGARLAMAQQLTRRYYAEHLFIESRVYPGVADGLRTLAGFGIALCVVTNKASAFTQPLLAAARLADFFQLVLCADRPEDRKPAPNLLAAACAHFGARPDALVYVGDSSTDVAAARAARCPVLLVDYGYGGDRSDPGADARIGSLAEMAALPLLLPRSAKME